MESKKNTVSRIQDGINNLMRFAIYFLKLYLFHQDERQ